MPTVLQKEDATVHGGDEVGVGLEALRQLSEAMEAVVEGDGRASGAEESGQRIPTGWPVIDEAIGGGLHRAGVHLFQGDLFEERSGVPWCPPLGVAIHLAWRVLTQEVRTDGRRIAWVGTAVKPAERMLLGGMRAGRTRCSSPFDSEAHGPCVHRAHPDRRLLEASFHVAVSRNDVTERLWAIEQAVSCPGVAMVVADGRDLAMPAMRRLQLAAIAAAEDSSGAHVRAGLSGPTGALLLVVRPPGEATVRSATATRWRVDASRCRGFTEEPTWAVGLLRARGRQALARFDRALVAHCQLDWEDHHDLENIEDLRAGRSEDLRDRVAILADRSRATEGRGFQGVAVEARIEPQQAATGAPAVHRRRHGRHCAHGDRWVRSQDGSAA